MGGAVVIVGGDDVGGVVEAVFGDIRRVFLNQPHRADVGELVDDRGELALVGEEALQLLNPVDRVLILGRFRHPDDVKAAAGVFDGQLVDIVRLRHDQVDQRALVGGRLGFLLGGGSGQQQHHKRRRQQQQDDQPDDEVADLFAFLSCLFCHRLHIPPADPDGDADDHDDDRQAELEESADDAGLALADAEGLGADFLTDDGDAFLLAGEGV